MKRGLIKNLWYSFIHIQFYLQNGIFKVIIGDNVVIKALVILKGTLFFGII